RQQDSDAREGGANARLMIKQSHKKSFHLTYPKELYEHLLRTMIRIRLCEESFVEPILSGEVRCPVHLYSGQEAVAAGVCAALDSQDHVFGTHRSHGHYLAKGGTMRALIAEVFCRETGCSRGRGGSMHVIDTEHGMLGSAPIVAGTISLAAGAALASKIRQDGRVTVSFFGDGAAGEGVLYETLNFAALHRLPLLLVCENNLYSTHLPIAECRAQQVIYKVASPFGATGMRVDGNKVLHVYGAACKAVASCREGRGPVLLECVTYRMRGHVGPDDNVQGEHTDIRPKDEVRRWRRRDPIKLFERFLLRENLASQDEITALWDEAKKEVEGAHLFARRSPHPVQEDLPRYVYA
ncbi:MAG: thiamine pyrophosphate-dependent dehydrogenase E1 component subunit alpha, partial [candidate division WOR-3 bacterium]